MTFPPRPAQLRRLGAYLGRLHQRARHFRPSRPRPPWSRRELVERSLEAVRARYRTLHPRRREPAEVLAAAAAATEAWRRLRPGSGFLHADLHLGNVKVRGAELYPLDFDDCGHGPWAYELGVLYFTESLRPDGDRRARELLEGYHSTSPFTVGVELLHLMALVRRLWVTAWISSHPEVFPDERARARLELEKRTLRALTRRLEGARRR